MATLVVVLASFFMPRKDDQDFLLLVRACAVHPVLH